MNYTMKNTKTELLAGLEEATSYIKHVNAKLDSANAETTKLTKELRECETKRNELDRERIINLRKWHAEQDEKRHISTGAADIYSNLREYEIASGLTLNALARLAEMCEVMHEVDKTLRPHSELLLVMVRYAQNCLLDARSQKRELRHSDETIGAIQQQLKWDMDYGRRTDNELT